MNRLKIRSLVFGLALAAATLVTLATPTSVPAQAVLLCQGQVPTIVGAGFIFGGPNNDVILGSPNVDVIHGGGGNDLICSLGENDTVNGGAGNDQVLAGTGDDRVRGGDGNDVLLGEAGDDNLQGGDGDDTLNGGPHNNGDVCNGGAGANVLIACNP
jgi:Ca2+-binding RTX toxin-like protein